MFHAFSLLRCTGKFSEVRLFLRKIRAESRSSVHTRSEMLLGTRNRLILPFQFRCTVIGGVDEQGGMNSEVFSGIGRLADGPGFCFGASKPSRDGERQDLHGGRQPE